MASISGGALVARMLRAEGVDVVFGIVDGSYFGLCAALREQGIRLISPRHEATAVHMAGAYARLTGRLGVCIASNGPGVANALSGVAVENAEGNRVLLIASWRRHGIIAPDRGGAYQYFAQDEVLAPMTKWTGVARSFERIPDVLRRAFRVSWRGRPGVVATIVPEDVVNGAFEDALPVLEPHAYRRVEPLAPAAAEVQRATDLLLGASWPLIHAGSGVLHAGASGALERVARALHAPVTTSWGGRAAIAETEGVSLPMNDPLLVGQVRGESDLVLVLGSRLGETDWWGKAPYWLPPAQQRMIQVDVDEDALGTNRPVELAILADARLFLEALDAEIARRGLAAPDGRAARLAACRDTRRRNREAAATLGDPAASPAHSAAVVRACRETFDEDAIFVVDGGNTAVWANLFLEVRSAGAHLSTFKFGMLGAGLGQALAAQVAFPDRRVCCIAGDGALGFHAQEIETAVRHDLPVIFVVLCDRQWGMVKYSQSMALDPDRMHAERSLAPGDTIGTDLSAVRLDLLAQSLGGHGERVDRADRLPQALGRCFASGRCSVVHVDVDPVEHLWAPGLDLFKAMHLEPGG